MHRTEWRQGHRREGQQGTVVHGVSFGIVPGKTATASAVRQGVHAAAAIGTGNSSPDAGRVILQPLARAGTNSWLWPSRERGVPSDAVRWSTSAVVQVIFVVEEPPWMVRVCS